MITVVPPCRVERNLDRTPDRISRGDRFPLASGCLPPNVAPTIRSPPTHFLPFTRRQLCSAAGQVVPASILPSWFDNGRVALPCRNLDRTPDRISRGDRFPLASGCLPSNVPPTFRSPHTPFLPFSRRQLCSAAVPFLRRFYFPGKTDQQTSRSQLTPRTTPS